MEPNLAAPTTPGRSRAALWLAGVFLFCFTYFLPKPGDWNQNARLDLALAIVNHGTVSTDPYHWQAGDDVLYRGHYYSNKAPGQTLVGLPILLAYKGLLTATGHGALASKMGLKHAGLMANYNFFLWQILESWYTVAIPTTLFLLLFFWFLGYFSQSLFNRVLLTLGLGLATDMFSYAGLFYPHSSTAALLFSAFTLIYLLNRPDRVRGKTTSWLVAHERATAALVGVALGLAFLFDHTSALPGVLIGAYGLSRVPLRSFAFVIVGALPWLVATLGYDYLTFHNIGVTGYNTYGSGVGGSDSHWPPAGYGLFGMTFSPYRGLFFLSPFLLLAAPGLAMWKLRGGVEWLLCLSVPLTFYIAVSTIPYWWGGFAVGPRYLIPVLPFLTLPVIFVLDRLTSWQARLLPCGLLALSWAAIWTETISRASGGFPPARISDPLFSYSLPALARGDVRLSMGTFLVGPFLGTHTALTLLPLGLLLGAWSLYCWRKSRQPSPGRLAVPVSP